MSKDPCICNNITASLELCCACYGAGYHVNYEYASPGNDIMATVYTCIILSLFAILMIMAMAVSNEDMGHRKLVCTMYMYHMDMCVFEVIELCTKILHRHD